jgi:hypothetical protein
LIANDHLFDVATNDRYTTAWRVDTSNDRAVRALTR